MKLKEPYDYGEWLMRDIESLVSKIELYKMVTNVTLGVHKSTFGDYIVTIERKDKANA